MSFMLHGRVQHLKLWICDDSTYLKDTSWQRLDLELQPACAKSKYLKICPWVNFDISYILESSILSKLLEGFEEKECFHVKKQLLNYYCAQTLKDFFLINFSLICYACYQWNYCNFRTRCQISQVFAINLSSTNSHLGNSKMSTLWSSDPTGLSMCWVTCKDQILW